MAYIMVDSKRIGITGVVSIRGVIYAQGVYESQDSEDGPGVMIDAVIEWNSHLQKWKICDSYHRNMVKAYFQGWEREELRETWGFDFPELDDLEGE
jgi:hypothetical protein